jgi:hypothetical protein
MLLQILFQCFISYTPTIYILSHIHTKQEIKLYLLELGETCDALKQEQT